MKYRRDRPFRGAVVDIGGLPGDPYDVTILARLAADLEIRPPAQPPGPRFFDQGWRSSIGSLAVAQADPTSFTQHGRGLASRQHFDGNGVWKSLDAGENVEKRRD